MAEPEEEDNLIVCWKCKYNIIIDLKIYLSAILVIYKADYCS